MRKRQENDERNTKSTAIWGMSVKICFYVFIIATVIRVIVPIIDDTANNILGKQEMASQETRTHTLVQLHDLLPRAQAGDKYAITQVATIYAIGPTPNFAEAQKWYQKGASLGSWADAYFAGILYEYENPPDFSAANQWLEYSYSLSKDKVFRQHVLEAAAEVAQRKPRTDSFFQRMGVEMAWAREIYNHSN